MTNLPFGLAAGESPGERVGPSEAGPANYKAQLIRISVFHYQIQPHQKENGRNKFAN